MRRVKDRRPLAVPARQRAEIYLLLRKAAALVLIGYHHTGVVILQ
jgi:hypothetical protein